MKFGKKGFKTINTVTNNAVAPKLRYEIDSPMISSQISEPLDFKQGRISSPERLQAKDEPELISALTPIKLSHAVTGKVPEHTLLVLDDKSQDGD